MKELIIYKDLLENIKIRVRQGQIRLNISANTEMLATYWDIGRMIYNRQKLEGWGKGIIPRLAIDLKNEIAEVKGFSERNLLRMLTFYREYHAFSISPLVVSESKFEVKWQPLVAKLENTKEKQNLILSTGWAKHIILIQKVKDLPTRYWYMQQCIDNGWSRDTLLNMVKSNLYKRQGNSATNFKNTLPPLQSKLAKQMLKDPYVFDFTTLSTEYTERELELELVKHLEKFLVELGSGFAFVGRQYKIEISKKDFYIDLLFYHLKMRCYIVIELKKGDFIPEYAGKMNFYCSAVDDLLKHQQDKATIGLILCQGKDKLFAEYSLKDINKPIGISEYELTRALPDDFKGSLPSIEELENELKS